MLNIAVVGGFDGDLTEPTPGAMRTFCSALGRVIVERGHRILGGAQTEIDLIVAEAANAATKQAGAPMILSWVAKGGKPVHNLGRVTRSKRESWDPGDSVRGAPEPIESCDVVILVGGFQGTRRAYWWATAAGKPVLPVAYFGGAAEEIFERELEAFTSKYGRRMRREDYERLNEMGDDFEVKAQTVVKLAEDIAHSQDVAVAMSYTRDEPLATQLRNVFSAYQQVCKEYGYVCRPVTEKTTDGHITQEILSTLSHAGFVIVDLTDVRPNVMYELGFADGLDRKVVTTARTGTELPFDVKDKPFLFWDPMDLEKLREDLRAKIDQIASKQGRSRGQN